MKINVNKCRIGIFDLQHGKFLHLSQNVAKQHLTVITASFMISLHSGHRCSAGISPTERVVGKPSISFSNAALLKRLLKGF